MNDNVQAPIVNATQSDILGINQIQLLLSEKRTSLSVMRTGIAILALPLSIFSVLIATSKLYDLHHVWLLLSLVVLLNFALIGFACFLIALAWGRMKKYDKKIADIKRQHSNLKHLI